MQFSLSIVKNMTNEMKFCFRETEDIKAHTYCMIKIDNKHSTIVKPITSKKCSKVAMTTLTLNLEFRQAKSIDFLINTF